MKKVFKTLVFAILLFQIFTTGVFADGDILSLYKGKASDNIPFSVANMFPGDYIKQDYVVRVSYNGTITVYFTADVRPEYKKLAEVLKCKVVIPDRNTILYDGLMWDIPDLANTISGVNTTEDLKYEIAVYLDTSAGNEYQEGSIQIDVLVSATQKDAESDSFGTEYDKGLTPPDRDGDILTVTEDGLKVYYLENGEVYLYDAQEYAESSAITLPEGITQLGDYSFTHSDVIKEVTLPSTVTSLGRAFDTSKVEKVTLNEGLEQIDSRAFKETKALEEVVIPSTVKVIADNAFQKSWLKEITIPATVETIGEASFGSSKIEKVTFMGNTSIQGYAFRGCPQLREVYLYGDDVTFIPSTLNGRNSMWFCNGESNNPNTSNITFYVANETVKERVLTAMGAERNNTTVIIMNP